MPRGLQYRKAQGSLATGTALKNRHHHLTGILKKVLVSEMALDTSVQTPYSLQSLSAGNKAELLKKIKQLAIKNH